LQKVSTLKGNQVTDLDLRLLRVMSALLETGGVGRAAEVLGVTPSAVSHSLSSLRTRLGDQLFVRDARGFSPTPRALAMQPRLQRALVDLQAVLTEEAEFDPRTSTQHFSLAATDCILERLPAAIASIRRVAPHVRINLLGINGPLSERLASGEVDLAFGYGDAESFLALDRETIRVSAGTNRFVCILRPDHFALRDTVFDLDRYLDLSHVFVRLSDRSRSVVNDSLEALGRERRILLAVSDARAAVRCVATSDLVATVPESVAHDGVLSGEVVAIAPPFELPAADAYLWWHMRVHADPSHIWWRNMVLTHLCNPSKSPVSHQRGPVPDHERPGRSAYSKIFPGMPIIDDHHRHARAVG
jgi:DNA-binding transcriptional LysR family regulator